MTAAKPPDTARRPAARAQAVECPGCGRVVAADSALCPVCWTDLRQAVALAPAEVEQREAQDREAATAKRRVRILRLVLAVVLVAFVVQRWQAGPDDLPRPLSTARGVVPASASPSQWPSEGGDASRTGATSAAAVLDGRVAWRADLGGVATTPLVAGEGVVYAGIVDGLVALSAADGGELWRVPITGQLDSAPTLAGDRLYASLRNGRLAAFDARNGRELWIVGTGAVSHTSPVVADGVVYVDSRVQDVPSVFVYAETLAPVLRAFDAETGAVLWEYAPQESAAREVNVAVGRDSVVMAASDRVALYSRRTNEELAHYTIDTPSHVVVAGERVLVTGRSRVAAFGLDQRRPWWEPARKMWVTLWLSGVAPAVPQQPHHWATAAPRVVLPPAVAGAVLVLATETGEVSARALETGVERWKYRAGALVEGPVATAGGVLLVERGALVLLDAGTGVERARRAFEGEAINAVAVTSHGTYVLTDGTKVVALRR